MADVALEPRSRALRGDRCAYYCEAHVSASSGEVENVNKDGQIER